MAFMRQFLAAAREEAVAKPAVRWPASPILPFGTALALFCRQGALRMYDNVFGIHESALLLYGQRELKYRNPYQASLDGNTVEMPVEQAAFSENNVRYQASLNFINNQISELQFAIAGQ
jgi:hypothetical protein